MRVLLCGESWVTHSVHVKGVDSFTTSSYTEGADHLRISYANSRANLTAALHRMQQFLAELT